MTTQLATVKRDLRTALQKESFTEMIATLAANRVKPDIIVEKAYFAISKNKDLLVCTKESLLTAIVASALLGLDCTGTLGQGYLVPFGKECVFIAGYQGLIELALKSKRVNQIEARPVYENDMFEVIFGTDQIIRHRPLLVGDRGDFICAYAIADTDKGQQIEIMRKDEINVIRDRSPGKGKGPWKSDYSEMCRKTVVRRLIKYIPKSPELIKAVEYDDGHIDFDPRHALPVESKTVTESIKEKIADKTEPPAEEPKKKTSKKTKPKENSTPQKSAESGSAQPKTPKADEKGSSEPAGSDAKEPAPPEDTSPTEPEGEPEKLKYQCTCGRQFNTLRDGKCPYCFSKKVTEIK